MLTWEGYEKDSKEVDIMTEENFYLIQDDLIIYIDQIEYLDFKKASSYYEKGYFNDGFDVVWGMLRDRLNDHDYNCFDKGIHNARKELAEHSRKIRLSFDKSGYEASYIKNKLTEFMQNLGLKNINFY